MKLRTLCAGALAALAFASPASAALLTSVNGANAVTDYSSGGLVSFDLDLQNASRTTLNFIVEESDLLAGSLSMNALVRNLTGRGIEHFRFSTEGISFVVAGSVTPAFGTVAGSGFDAGGATVDFGAPELAEFQFGDVFGQPGASNWVLNLAGLRAGDAFAITAAVPEPGTTSLLLAGLALAALRRKKRN